MIFSSILTLAKPMHLNVGALACVASLLVGCASLQGKAVAIEPGTTRAAVLKIMGPPQERSFQGSRDEALQYCSAGFLHHDYLIVWLRDGKVHGMTSYKQDGNSLFCYDKIRTVDWGQAPYDLRIKIDKNINVE
ncbi:MAG: hypothetical protein MPJ81_00020 [Gammaproteobacteria bacterium]|nr:hypothetical protein [Gammaproteobacteria bacterium]